MLISLPWELYQMAEELRAHSPSSSLETCQDLADSSGAGPWATASGLVSQNPASHSAIWF